MTIYDSEIHGEYLGWHSKKLKLVNCHIPGLNHCAIVQIWYWKIVRLLLIATFAFEDSIVRATINSAITSVKNLAPVIYVHAVSVKL